MPTSWVAVRQCGTVLLTLAGKRPHFPVMALDLHGRTVPPRAVVLSTAALAVPVLGALQFPEQLGEHGALLWLTVLLPAFILAYYRAWRGIATALALGVATLSVTQGVALFMGRTVPDMLLGVVVAYVAIALGIGWLAENFHQDRAEVEDMAFTDILTHLPNRRHARLFLEKEFAAAERGRQLSLVLLDLDDFKEYNDTYGHPTGDSALTAFGEILEVLTRRMDLSARFGGEEFVSVLTSTDTEGALIFADRIRAVLAKKKMEGGGRLTVSAGVATYHPSMRSSDELLAAADHALYQAKHDGRNCVRVFGKAMMDVVRPSPDAPQGVLEALRAEPQDYPRAGPDTGKSRPPLTLLPHQITGFGQDRRVLVVEDDDQVRSLITNYLEREGFYVDEAVDVVTGLDQLVIEYDVVITDLRLPGQSGTELVAAAKSRWPQTQILVITGLHDATVVAEALRAGADCYLFKPFGMPALRRHLIDSLNRRAQTLERRESSADLSEEARARASEARQAVLEGTASLVRAAEARDPFTVDHSARVGTLALRLAEELDPEGTEIDRAGLELGCRLKDIGELGLPDRILNKPDALSLHERESIERHPTIGRQVLQPLMDGEVAVSVVGWHHERWDGRGYPDGLAGHTIPVAARIAALCDALDAMIYPRAHRAAHPWDAAVRSIQDDSGKAFDPDIVEAMGRCLDDLKTIATQAEQPAL
jgi:putative two-component system response regulator